MIRVLHFIPAFCIGGVESLILSLYKEIDKSKVQFDFLVEVDECLDMFSTLESYGAKVYKLDKLDKKRPWRYIQQVKHFFSKHKGNYITLHCHNMERGLIVLYYAKKYDISCRVFHAHTDSFKGINYEPIMPLVIYMDTFLSTHLLACSKVAGDFQFKNKPYNILKNAIDAKRFSFNTMSRKISREQMGLGDTFVVGHTGRFTYAKNHSKIVDIFDALHSKYANARLLLVGDGPLKKEIEEQVNHLGLSHVVIFTGNKSNIEDMLQSMDLFLLPSFYEGFCISLLEAQATGLHCITSDVIPPEVEMTPLITKLSLEEDDSKWAEEILKYKIYTRESQTRLIKENGYDVSENAKWLMEYYLDN